MDTVLVNVITGEVNSDIDVPTLTNEERAEVSTHVVHYYPHYIDSYFRTILSSGHPAHGSVLL